MSIQKRLFIGNIHGDVKGADLRTRFHSFGTVEKLELRSKNDDHFAFIDMEFPDIHAMRNCVEGLNNTRWKGLTLKVQYAKESFLEKLKRERAQARGGQTSITASATSADNPKPTATSSNGYGYARKPFRPERPRRPDNFDFEIVGSGGESTKSSDRETVSIKRESEVESNELESKSKKRKTPPSPEQPTKFVIDNTNCFTTNLVGFEEAGVVNSPPRVISSPVKVQEQPQQPSPIRKQKQRKKRRGDSSSSDDSSGDEKGGVPRFRGLASYGDSLFVPPVQLHESLPAIGQSNVETPLEAIPINPAFATAKDPNMLPPKEFKLKMNPHKKAKSDELRIKSLSSREELLSQRSNLIRSSLSKVEPPAAPVTASTVSKDALFAQEEDDEEIEEEISFKVKPQYEGTSGQKMLKLKSSYGDDERFQLDERFAEASSRKKSASDNLDNSEQGMQLGVLEKLVGPTAPIPKAKSEPKKDLRFVRFDPTLLEHQQYVLNPQKLPAPAASAPPNVVESKKEPKKKQKDQGKAIEEEKAKLKDPTAKTTFKVAENIKTLFAKESEATPAFSFLTAFGSNGNEEGGDAESTKGDKKKKDSNKPRDNWNKNPFKYDSSDSEEEITKKKSKKRPAAPPPAPSATALKTEVKAGSGFFKNESFFFAPKDERLKGIFLQFLSPTENSEEIAKEFNATGRSELKAIAKSKMKNAKRKGEKKIKFQRLARKKKKREALAKQKKYEERKSILNKKE